MYGAEAGRMDWKDRVLNDYSERMNRLASKYVANSEANGPGDESCGSDRFLSTFLLTINRAQEMLPKADKAVKNIYDAMNIIAERSYAGRTAWQMRRFIRRAPSGMLPAFGYLLKRWAEVSPDRVWLDMDDYYWNMEGGAEPNATTIHELKRLKWNIDNNRPMKK